MKMVKIVREENSREDLEKELENLINNEGYRIRGYAVDNAGTEVLLIKNVEKSE